MNDWPFRILAPSLFNGGPVLMPPQYYIPRMSDAELLADTLDLLYDVEEFPVAIDRLADDGCPLCGEVPTPSV